MMPPEFGRIFFCKRETTMLEIKDGQAAELELKRQLKADIDGIDESKGYMSKEHIAFFRKYLLELDTILQHKLFDVKKLIKETRQDGADSLDAADVQIELDRNRQREHSLMQQQKSIGHALEAMRNDEYGYCCACGEEIGYDRMMSMPWSIRDAECAKVYELKGLQITGSRFVA